MKTIALSFFVALSFYSVAFAQDQGLFEFREFQKAVTEQYPIELKTGKNIQKIILGDKQTPDIDTSDNVYQR